MIVGKQRSNETSSKTKDTDELKQPEWEREKKKRYNPVEKLKTQKSKSE